MKEFDVKEKYEDMEFGYVELRLKMNGDSAALAAKLQEHYQGIGAIQEMFKMCSPKIQSNGDYLEVGLSFPCLKEILKNINYEKLAPIID